MVALFKQIQCYFGFLNIDDVKSLNSEILVHSYNNLCMNDIIFKTN